MAAQDTPPRTALPKRKQRSVECACAHVPRRVREEEARSRLVRVRLAAALRSHIKRETRKRRWQQMQDVWTEWLRQQAAADEDTHEALPSQQSDGDEQACEPRRERIPLERAPRNVEQAQHDVERA